MNFGRFTIKDAYVVRLDEGEKVVESLSAFAEKQRIHGAVVTSLVGAISDLEYITPGAAKGKPKPHAEKRKEPMEIVASGSVSRDEDNKPHVHLHGSAGPKGEASVTGHVVEATVKYFCEVVICEFNERLLRKHDEKLGLAVLDPDHDVSILLGRTDPYTITHEHATLVEE